MISLRCGIIFHDYQFIEWKEYPWTTLHRCKRCGQEANF